MDLSIEGFMGERDLLQIEEWAKQVPENGVIVEVGSYKGRSASAWAEAHPSVKIYCIDYFYHLDEFKQNTQQWKNIIPIRGQSPNAIRYPGDMIDVFFLDAEHCNPTDWMNIEYFLPLIKKGGLLCGHDYPDPRFPDIVDNIKLLEKKLNQTVTHHPGTQMYSFRI